ncbi:hypothetical protein ABFX02_04G052000 [Erythranthe guttata]
MHYNEFIQTKNYSRLFLFHIYSPFYSLKCISQILPNLSLALYLLLCVRPCISVRIRASTTICSPIEVLMKALVCEGVVNCVAGKEKTKLRKHQRIRLNHLYRTTYR